MVFLFLKTFVLVAMFAVLLQLTLTTWPQSIFLITAVGMALAFWAICIEPDRLLVRNIDVYPPGWPRHLNGVKIAVVGCFHVGAPFIGTKKLSRIVEEINAVHPDVVVLLGDFVSGFVLGAKRVSNDQVAEQLSRLTAPSVAVLGNHDYWNGESKISSALEKHGISVLRNSTKICSPRDIPISGLDYVGDYTERIESAISQQTLICLTHSPDVFPLIPKTVPLTIASHTHGGQVRLPLVGALMIPSKFGDRYASGVFHEFGKTLFVTSGVGTSILPMRFLCPPEIVVLTVNTPDVQAGVSLPGA